MGASLFTTAVDLKRHKSQGELWAWETAACTSASKGILKAGARPWIYSLPSPSPSFYSYPVMSLHPEAGALGIMDRR